MIHKPIDTYEAKIWVGFKEKYDGPEHSLYELRQICRKYVDQVKLCVTITPTEYVYVGGGEPGAVVGLIQYPRFEVKTEELRAMALKLAHQIMVEFKQYRMSVVTSDGTYMLENDELK